MDFSDMQHPTVALLHVQILSHFLFSVSWFKLVTPLVMGTVSLYIRPQSVKVCQ